MSFLDWLGLGTPRTSTADDADTVRRIASALDALPPERARYLAAFAYLLGRVAHADLDISDDETRAMERLVVEWSALPPAQAVLVVELAKSQNRLFGGAESLAASRELRDHASREDKHAVLHALFAVSAADDTISTVEEEEIRKIAKEIGLSHEEYVSIRAAYRDKRAILRT